MRHKDTEGSPAEVQLQPILPEQQPVLERLYQLYRYDLSEFNNQDIRPDGSYPHIDLAQYVTDSNFCSRFITFDNTLAGFALVNLHSHTYMDETVKNLDDFFVLKKYRRKGIGTRAAYRLFREMPGLWQVNKKTYNEVAMRFWERVVREFTDGDFSEHIALSDIHIHIFRAMQT